MAQQQFKSLEEVQAFLAQNPQFKGKVVSDSGQATQIAPQEPKKNILQNIIGGVIDPFIGLGKKGLELTNAVATNQLGEFVRGDQSYKRQFLNDEDYEKFVDNPFMDTTKDVAGVASVLLPGGMFGKGIAGLAKAGAASGALSSFATQEGNNLDLGNIAQGALTGGVMGGAFGAAEKGLGALKNSKIASKASGTLNEFADGRDLNALKNRVGTPAPFKDAGALLEKDVLDLSKRFGKQINSADDLAKFSDELFSEYGGAIRQASEAASEKGALIDLNKTIIEPLQNKLNKPGLTDKVRQPILDVINDIKTIAPNGIVDPATAYQAKQVIGDLGKFRYGFDASDAAQVSAYQDAYKSLNDELRSTLKSAGFDKYDEVNKVLETAIRQKKWAETALGKVRPKATANDMMQDVGLALGIGTGNPLAAIPGMVIGKAMQSPQAETILGKAARGVAGFLDNFSPKGAKAAVNQADNLAAGVGAQADDILAKAGENAKNTANNLQPREIKKAILQDPDLAPLAEMLDMYEGMIKEMNTGRLGNQIAQVRRALNAGRDAEKIPGVDVLAQEIADEFPGVVKMTDVTSPSDLIEEFLMAKDKLQKDVDGVYSMAREQIAAKQSAPTITPTTQGAAMPNITIPSMPVPQNQNNPIAQFLQKAGGAAKGVKQFVDDAGISRIKLGPNAPGKIGGIAGGAMQGAMTASAEGDPNVVDVQTFLNEISNRQGQVEQQAPQTRGLDPEAAQMYQQLVTPAKQGGMGFSPSEAEKYMSNVYGMSFGSGEKGGGKITESQKKFMAAGQQAQSALDILDSGEATTGKIAAVKNKVGEFLGNQREVQTDYKSKLAAARGSAVSALAGANVPPAEYARIADMIPEETDEPRIARQKLKSFTEAMQTYASAGN